MSEGGLAKKLRFKIFARPAQRWRLGSGVRAVLTVREHCRPGVSVRSVVGLRGRDTTYQQV